MGGVGIVLGLLGGLFESRRLGFYRSLFVGLFSLLCRLCLGPSCRLRVLLRLGDGMICRHLGMMFGELIADHAVSVRKPVNDTQYIHMNHIQL